MKVAAEAEATFLDNITITTAKRKHGVAEIKAILSPCVTPFGNPGTCE